MFIPSPVRSASHTKPASHYCNPGASTMRRRRSVSQRRAISASTLREVYVTAELQNEDENKRGHACSSAPKLGLGPRPVGGAGKLGTFSGVYVPTCLNVLSILMFLRFGLIVGQSGVVGTMGRDPLRLHDHRELTISLRDAHSLIHHQLYNNLLSFSHCV